ncbi:MAG: LysM peptidoglycan-binding domain-containing protein [Saprospiraceae bacterium]|nr:LysM peptidoglycan-binding domain-containing protein [Saprospiraceae bacterium]
MTSESAAAQGDSTHYLTQNDTLFMYLDEQSSEKIIEHRIQKKQTLYSLARFYGLNEEQLFPYNPTLKNNKLNIGQVVRVPLPNMAIKRFKGQNFKRWKYAPLLFKVQKGDNLYKIAKRVFNMSPDSVVLWNGLQNDIIAPGQTLQVGWVSVEGIPDSLRGLRKVTVDLNTQALGKNLQPKKDARGTGCSILASERQPENRLLLFASDGKNLGQ